jgi:hypothetical protein
MALGILGFCILIGQEYFKSRKGRGPAYDRGKYTWVFAILGFLLIGGAGLLLTVNLWLAGGMEILGFILMMVSLVVSRLEKRRMRNKAFGKGTK